MALGTYVIGGVLVGSGALTAFLAAFAWRRRHVVGADWFAATLAFNTLWIALDVVELVVVRRSILLALETASTACATVVPALWFCFVLAYTGRGHLLDRRGLAAIWSVPVVVLATLFTWPVHDLYYGAFTFSSEANRVAVDARPGPVAWLNLAYFAVLVGVGLWLVARMLWEHERLYSRQAVWLLVGTLAPVCLLVLVLVGEVPAGLPVISLGFSVLGLSYVHGLFSHRFLDLSPASRRIGIPEAFDDLGEGVVIANIAGDVVAINERACQLFDCRKAAVLGEPIDRVSPALVDVDDGTATRDVEVDNRVLAVNVSRVQDARGRPTGSAFVVRDVTADRRRQQRLNVLSRIFRHNIRNRMNVVVGPTSVLADRLDGDDAHAATVAYEAGQSVVALSEKVRAVEEMMTGELTRADVGIAALVENAIAAVRDDARFTVRTAIPPDCRVRTDPDVLAVVFENVLENAVEHGAAAGSHGGRPAAEHDRAGSPQTPTRQTGPDQRSPGPRSRATGEDDHGADTSEPAVADPPADAVEDDGTEGPSRASPGDPPEAAGAVPQVEITVEDRAGGCLVRVTDDGPGIPQAELDVLRAGTETELEHASGLGLWAVHWGMSRIDGAVRFENASHGARVTLWIPDLGGGPAAPPPSDEVTADGTGARWFGRAGVDDPADATTSDDRP